MIARRWSYAIGIGLLAGLLPSLGVAQDAIKPSDIVGTWEKIARKNLRTGAVDSIAKHGVHWQQYTASHWTLIEMETGRPAIASGDLAKLSPAEQVKANYAKVWDDKNKQIFAARGGTYRIEGNVLHRISVVALQPAAAGLNEQFTIIHLDHDTLVYRTPPDDQGVAVEVTFRRLN